MIKLKDLLTEAPQIKKVKNVSVQYLDAEFQGETLHGFKYFKKGPWLYKKNNGEYFAVVITNKSNRYEIQLGKHKNNIQATAAVEKIIKKNLNKFESINEGKANMNLYKKVVKALKDIPVRASIHLDTDGDLSICLGFDYYRKKNPEGTGDLSDMVEDRLKKAGIQKGYNSPPGVSIMASTSNLDDAKNTKAQHDIRGGVD